jgi:methionyl-tRNA synthetase
MSNKYFGGTVTDRSGNETPAEAALDAELKETVLSAVKKVRDKMKDLRVADAVSEVWNIFKRCNKYIDETAPWVLAKDAAKSDRLNTVLYNLTESIVTGASLLFSFMPETSEKILKELNTEKRPLESMDRFGLLPSGTRVVSDPVILFARLDPKEVEARLAAAHEAEEAAAAAAAPAPAAAAPAVSEKPEKPEITYDDFARLSFKVGEILQCEAVPKSKKLLCSQVKIGNRTVQILSGIRKWYTPEEMVGKKVMVVANLKPAMLAGMKSEGMLLCAEDENGTLALMTPEKEIGSGAEIC